MSDQVVEPGQDGAHNPDSSPEHFGLKLVVIHFGASGSRNPSKKQLELAKIICEQVMTGSKHYEQTRRHSEEAKCANEHCQCPDEAQDDVHKMSAVDAVVRLVQLMEDQDALNCGYGSNLNMDGKVECDASMMSGRDGLWTGVGAVTCCKNPIKLAHSMMKHSKIRRVGGLVRPNYLVASGAKQWMLDHCPQLLVPASHLISGNALSRYQLHKSFYDNAAKVKTPTMDEEIRAFYDDRIDTVGAIAIDCDNNIACAISSGGVVLKQRGRVGSAGIPGAGCWAQELSATVTTGVGEYLTTTLFARAFHEKLAMSRLLNELGHTSDNMDSMINKAMTSCFNELLASPALSHVNAKQRFMCMVNVSLADNNNHGNNQRQQAAAAAAAAGGSASVNEQDFYLSYGHSSDGLCIGYMLGSAQEAVSFMSCLDYDQAEEVGSTMTNRVASSRTQTGFHAKTLNLGH